MVDNPNDTEGFDIKNCFNSDFLRLPPRDKTIKLNLDDFTFSPDTKISPIVFSIFTIFRSFRKVILPAIKKNAAKFNLVDKSPLELIHWLTFSMLQKENKENKEDYIKLLEDLNIPFCLLTEFPDLNEDQNIGDFLKQNVTTLTMKKYVFQNATTVNEEYELDSPSLKKMTLAFAIYDNYTIARDQDGQIFKLSADKVEIAENFETEGIQICCYRQF